MMNEEGAKSATTNSLKAGIQGAVTGFVAGGIAGTIAGGYQARSELNAHTQSLFEKIEACYQKIQSVNASNNGAFLPSATPAIRAFTPPPLTLETFCRSLSEKLRENISAECDTLSKLLEQESPYTITDLSTLNHTCSAIKETLGEHLPNDFIQECDDFLTTATQGYVKATCSNFNLTTLQSCTDFVSNALGTTYDALVVSAIETMKTIIPNSLDNVKLIKDHCRSLVHQGVPGAEEFCNEVKAAAIQQFAAFTCSQEGLSEPTIEACTGLISAAVNTFSSPENILQNINATIALMQQETIALADVETVSQNCQYLLNNITQPELQKHCLTLIREAAKKTTYSEQLLGYLNSGLDFAYHYGAVPIATATAEGLRYSFKAAAFLVYLAEQGLDVAKNCANSTAVEELGASGAQAISDNSTEVALALTTLAAVEYRFQPIRKTLTFGFDMMKKGTQMAVDATHRTLESFVSDDAREASKARLG